MKYFDISIIVCIYTLYNCFFYCIDPTRTIKGHRAWNYSYFPVKNFKIRLLLLRSKFLFPVYSPSTPITKVLTCALNINVSPVSGGRAALPSSPTAASRGHSDGTSDLVVDASYYNFYQPTRYPAYYSNLYNYQQYQVSSCTSWQQWDHTAASEPYTSRTAHYCWLHWAFYWKTDNEGFHISYMNVLHYLFHVSPSY